MCETFCFFLLISYRWNRSSRKSNVCQSVCLFASKFSRAFFLHLSVLDMDLTGTWGLGLELGLEKKHSKCMFRVFVWSRFMQMYGWYYKLLFWSPSIVLSHMANFKWGNVSLLSRSQTHTLLVLVTMIPNPRHSHLMLNVTLKAQILL